MSEIPATAATPETKRSTRTTPLVLINLGLPRTGTKSLRKALQVLGYANAYHYDTILPSEHPEHCAAWNEAYRLKYLSSSSSPSPYTPAYSSPSTISTSQLNWTTLDWDNKLLGSFSCLSDNPCISFATELLTAYPDAKLLLSVRDSSAVWANSYASTIAPVEAAFHHPTRNPLTWLYRWFVKRRNPFVAMVDNITAYGPTRGFEERWEQEGGGVRIYEEWNDWVRQQGQGRKAGFLEFNVKQGWAPLCEFLGKEIPPADVPFPRLNDKEEFLRLWQLEEKGNYAVMDWRIWAAALLGLVVPLLVVLFLVRDGVWKVDLDERIIVGRDEL